jgi:hypothetical protein
MEATQASCAGLLIPVSCSSTTSLSRNRPMTGRLANLLRQLSTIIRYRFLAFSSDPKSMYEFVNLLTRFDHKRRRSGLPEIALGELLTLPPMG